MPTTIKTPGVYINEINSDTHSVIPVATAVPAFIGYTPKIEYEGKSYLNKVQKINSLAEFESIYMLDNPPAPADPLKQYSPEYYLVPQEAKPLTEGAISIEGNSYSILPDPDTIYYLYNSVRMFFDNGGAEAYIVSTGLYGEPRKKPVGINDTKIVNQNIKLDDLIKALEPLNREDEPTLYYCPDATLLSASDNGTLMQKMLLQAENMESIFCLFDIIEGRNSDLELDSNDIESFRNNTGSEGLKNGASYYPFLNTTMMQEEDIDFTSLFGGDITKLEPLLNPVSNPNTEAKKLLDMMKIPPAKPLTNSQIHTALLKASATYSLIIKHVLKDANILPPCGGIAGIYARNDSQRGVWNAPANMDIEGASDLTVQVTDSQQQNLNIDVISGKSVNAIRYFNGKGILVWGARTLDGNSQDWRFVSARRTGIFLEQSIKTATRGYVFEPNNANTWVSIKSMINNFLTGIWKQGGLQGSAPADAFQVEVGLGSTMTEQDLLNGFLRIAVKVALSSPAEFTVMTFQEEMSKSG